MELFEEIYRETMLLRLQEARALNTIEEIYRALKKDDSGRRYIETLLNGKKNLPEWFRTLADYDNLDLIKQPLETLLNRFKDEPKNTINDAICLLFRKSDSIDTMKNIIKNSMDTLLQYAKNAKTQWISKLNTYDEIMTQNYSPELWHDFEKEVQDFKDRRDVNKGKEVSDEVKATLYDTLYEDATWGLYVPKSFEGDKELASHIKEFESCGRTFNKTQWCTAAQAQYFNHYSYNGKKPLYVIKYFENGVYTEAWQIAFMIKHIEIMDKRDKRNFDFLFKNAPMELFNKIIDKTIETESYIFPSLVKMYNNSTGNFDLDRTYSVILELNTVSDDVRGLIDKEIPLEEIIKLRGFLPEGSLGILIKGLANLKNRGYSLEFINNAISVLGLGNTEELEECINIIEGNITLDELKELINLIGQYYWDSIDLETLVRLRGSFSLEELKELMNSLGYGYLGYDDLLILCRLGEKGYSSKYLSDAYSAFDLESIGGLEKSFKILEGNFSPDSSEFEYYGYPFDYILSLSKSLREKGIDFKEIIDILNNSNELKISNINNDEILDYIVYLKKKGMSALKFFKTKSDLGWEDYNTLEEYLNLLEKGEAPDLSKINGVHPEQIFKITNRETLKLMAKDIRDGLIPEGMNPQAYPHFGRENIINFFKYKEMGAFDNTATIGQFIEYGAQNLNDINVLKHQGRLWPALDIEDCFQLGPQKALEISRELFSSNLPKNIKLEDYFNFSDNLNFLRLYGNIKEKLIENQVEDIERKGLLSADDLYTLIMDIIRKAIENAGYDFSINEEDIPFSEIESVAKQIVDAYINEKQRPEDYYYEGSNEYYRDVLDDVSVDIDGILDSLEDDEE